MRPCLVCGQPAKEARCPVHARPGPRQRGLDRAYERAREFVLSRSRICWWCGHPGADQADHVITVADGGTSDVGNLRPIHGTKPCMSCNRRCNQDRGNAERRR